MFKVIHSKGGCSLEERRAETPEQARLELIAMLNGLAEVLEGDTFTIERADD